MWVCACVRVHVRRQRRVLRKNLAVFKNHQHRKGERAKKCWNHKKLENRNEPKSFSGFSFIGGGQRRGNASGWIYLSAEGKNR